MKKLIYFLLAFGFAVTNLEASSAELLARSWNKFKMRHFPDKISIQTFFEAMRNKDYACITKLIEQGININSIQDRFWKQTPLINAITSHDKEMVAFLLQSGANPNPKDNDHSPLITAIYLSKVAIIQLLLDYKANPYLQNPLKLALHLGRPDVATVFINHGVPLDPAVLNFNCTVPLSGIQKNHITESEMFLCALLDKKIINLNTPIDTLGNTTLHFAAHYDCPELVAKYLKRPVQS